MALLTLERLAGTMSDEDAALKLGLEASEVRAWRASHGIKRYRRPRGGKLVEEPAPPSPTRLLRRKRGAREVEEILVAPPQPSLTESSSTSAGETTMAESKKTTTAKPSKGRKSAAALLDGVKDKLGKLPDDQIAAEVGLSRGVVGAYRRTHNIPAYEGYLFQKGHAPLGPKTATKANAPKKPKAAKTPKAAPAPEVPAAAPPRASVATSSRRGPRSRIEDFLHLLGVETDAEVARLAGVTRAAVSAWRRNRGITASRSPGGVPREAAPVAAPAPVAPAPVAAPAPAAEPRTSRKAAPSTGRFAFQVTASSGDRKLEFVAIGATMSDACAAAQGWLDARGDGAWRLDEVRHLSEAVL